MEPSRLLSLCVSRGQETEVHWILAAIALHFLMKSAGSLSAVFPAVKAVVAFLATETGTITELASGKSEPRHPGDWLWTELSLNRQLSTR